MLYHEFEPIIKEQLKAERREKKKTSNKLAQVFGRGDRVLNKGDDALK